MAFLSISASNYYLVSANDADRIALSLFLDVFSHNPSSLQSVQALSLLKSALSAPYPPSVPSSSPLQFDLDVVEKTPPTPDQLKIISSYLPAASSSRLSSSLQNNDSHSQPLSPNSRSLAWPIVVDWYAGNASIGDVEGVKDILESIRQKRDGDAKGPE
jgi:hypothetical protein